LNWKPQVLKGGKFWALARTGQSTALKGKDVSNGYILLATACDGTLATTAQFTSIRVVCNNTLAIALRNGSTSAGVVKVPHSTRFDAEKVKQQLGISVRAWDEHMYEMKQLSQRKVTQQEAQPILMRYLTIPVSALLNRMTALSSSTAMWQMKPMQPIKPNRMDEPCRKSWICLMVRDEVQNSVQPKVQPMACCVASPSLSITNVEP
jgi:phage/plasmid-like protein (TIGR03299 family)